VDDTPLTNLTIPKAWVTGGKESFQKTYPTPAPKDFSKDISGDFSKDFSKDLSLDPPITSFPWEGGETTGLKRAKYYNQTSKGILNYRSTRNEISGEDFSTKFSPWLAHGCLSARLVYEQASTRGKKENKGYAIQKFLDEMTWREFFWHVARDHSPQFFQPAGLLGKARPNKFDLQKFNSWKDGTTKSPLINAFMRELASTGFMSNRGRQVVASYLIHDLSQPWTAGAWWFQHALIDFDPTQNWGNWLHASGVGTDPVPNRKFNPYLQAQKYDPMGDFQRGWGVSKAIYKAVGVTHTTQTLHPQPHPHPLLPLAYND
jgi:deoxyribodipyrimidine photo-lyase